VRDHGTRASYQAGCSCTPCRAGNAGYQAQYRRLSAVGTRPLRSLVKATLLRRVLRQLTIEGFTEAEIARRLGLRDPRLTRETEQVTWRKVLQLRWFRRQVLVGGEQESYARGERIELDEGNQIQHATASAPEEMNESRHV
jgi:hypothetical protein